MVMPKLKTFFQLITIKIVFIYIFITLTACVQKNQKDGHYSVKNATPENIDNFKVSIGTQYAFTFGTIVPASRKSFSGLIPMQTDNDILLGWTTESGKSEVRAFNASKSELMDKRQIEFIINPDGTITRGWRFP